MHTHPNHPTHLQHTRRAISRKKLGPIEQVAREIDRALPRLQPTFVHAPDEVRRGVDKAQLILLLGFVLVGLGEQLKAGVEEVAAAQRDGRSLFRLDGQRRVRNRGWEGVELGPEMRELLRTSEKIASSPPILLM
jgi:hypothetical protein